MEGASNNERLLSAAKTDNDDLLLEVFEQEGTYDINYVDGLGNTALHYAVSFCSTTVLEHILTQEGCDVDPQDRMTRSTPLHLAVKIQDQDIRQYIVDSLLEAGADNNIRDKSGSRPSDLLSDSEPDRLIRIAFRKAEADASISKGDIASDDDDSLPGSDVASDED